jgi:hypothetical protein
MSAKNYAHLIAAIAGAWIGWTLGATIASGITLPVDSFWARAQLTGVVLQFGGAAAGAISAYILAKRLLRD